jgi:hypothetical protein
MEWISKLVFGEKKGKESIVNSKQWWHYPPVPLPTPADKCPKLEAYFGRALFFWRPKRVLEVLIYCPSCKERGVKQEMASHGIYRTVRRVIDVDRFYYLASEYVMCEKCKRSFASWSSEVLQQLPEGLRLQFPALLTYQYAVDMKVVLFMRSRTLGNSPAALRQEILQQHFSRHQALELGYLQDLERYSSVHHLDETDLPPPTPLHKIPTSQYFQSVHTRDVWANREGLLEQLTSVTGSILKMDSTKSITKKLQGVEAGAACWATSVGNEHGQVLQCVMTASEGSDHLQAMAVGLQKRFADHGVPEPKLLYVDRDCCAGVSEFHIFTSQNCLTYLFHCL